MCGLLLYFDRCAQIDVRRFKEALDLMHHRGPDNQSIFTFKKNLNASPQLLDNSVNDLSNVTLAIGHNRLSIFDLSNHSNQPLLNTSQDKFLIYNGEFYNFSDYSDSETQNSDALALFKLLSKNPTTTFDHVNGMWASVFGDLKKRKLYLSRDRYGKKPLYYFQNKTSLIVSSEIKAIFHILGKPRVVNPNILANFIYGKLSPFPVTTETFYESIHSINPGCNYVYNFENGQFRLDSRVVWKELQDIGNIPLNESNLEEQISFELRDSIKLRMNADVDVAIPISGGIDSSFIVGTANEILDRSKLKLYTCHIYGKEGLTADLGYARRIAKKLDLPLIEVETNQTSEDDFLKTVQNLVSIAEIPINYFLASIPTFQLSQQMHKNGIKVSVDGIGADEVFAGYKDYASLALANATSFKPFESMRFFAKWFKTVPAKRHEQVILFLRLVKKMIFNHGEHHIQNTPIDLMLPHFSNDKLVESIKRAGRQTFTRNNICTTSERQLHDLTRYQIPYYLGTADQFSMANSIENRSPFLDYRLIKYTQISDKFKNQKGYNKYLLRTLMPKNIGKDVIWRRDKKGFGTSYKNIKTLSDKSLDIILDSDFVRSLVSTDTVKKDFLGKSSLTRYLLPLAMLDHKYKIIM